MSVEDARSPTHAVLSSCPKAFSLPNPFRACRFNQKQLIGDSLEGRYLQRPAGGQQLEKAAFKDEDEND
jgi:hypothetical protein